MKNYKVTTRLCASWTHKIRAKDAEEAERIAKEFAENEPEENITAMKSEIVEIDDDEIVDNRI